MTIKLIISAGVVGIGLISLKKKTPVKFWSIQVIKVHEISNVKSYNKETGLMWITYGIALVLCSLLQFLLGDIIGPIAFALTLVAGIVVMVNKYGKIYTKYKI